MNDSTIKKSALVIATLGTFLTPFMGSAINVALPSIQKEFQMNAVLLSWIATGYLMAAAVSLVPFGRLADIYGRKKIFSAGVILASQFVVQAAFSPLAGKLSDKIEPRIVATAGMATTAIGLLLLALIGSTTGVGFIVVSLILIGLGFGFFAPPNANAIMSSVEKKFYGVASGSLGTMRVLGQMTGMGIITLVFNVYIGRVEISPDLYPAFVIAFKIAFGIFFILAILGIFASMVGSKVKPAGSDAGTREGRSIAN